MVYEYKHDKLLWIYHGGPIMNGAFFHDKVADPIFATIAKGDDLEIEHVLEKSTPDLKTMTESLWAHLDTHYFNTALNQAKLPTGLSGDQIITLANGVGLLAKMLSEFIQSQRKEYSGTDDLIKGAFLPSEQKISATLTTNYGHSVTVTGKYDALLFDRNSNEFVVIEFKCKGDEEVIGDSEQLAAYSWLIRSTSGIPARGAILYICDEGEIKNYSASELEQSFETSKNLIGEIANWLTYEDLLTAHVPPTMNENICIECPLNESCETTFGPRDPMRIEEFRRELRTERPGQSTGQTSKQMQGVELGISIDDPTVSIEWNPWGGSPALTNGHMLIVGTSGSGKTQVLRAILSELVNKNVLPLVFDYNDDYVDDDFREPYGFKLVNPLHGLPINPLELTPDLKDGNISVMSGVFEIAGILRRIYGLGPIQEVNLRNAIAECYLDYGMSKDSKKIPEKGFPLFEEVENKILEIPSHASLLARLSPIFSLGLFMGSQSDDSFNEFIRKPRIIRLVPLPTEEVKLAVTEFILLKLYNYLMTCENLLTPNRAIIIDEAHKVTNSAAVVKLFREIRKKGVAMILSSQKAKDFDPDIHSNAASVLFLKNSEITDRKYVADQLKSTDKQKNEIIDSLGSFQSFEGFFRNDQYSPFVRMRVTPYFERLEVIQTPL
jgi:CRISPR/Cas system-associated exonuclease Cas4 (RecB family)